MQIKNYNAVLDGRNFFHQPVKNNLTTYDNIGKIATGHGDNFTAGCLLDYNHFNNYYKMIAIDLNKQQNIWCWSKSNTAVNFTANLDRDGNTAMSLIIEEAKRTILDFSQEIRNYCECVP